MTAYTTAFAVGDLLGVTLNDEQMARADLAIASAAAMIDQAIGQSWLDAGTVTDEWQMWTGDRLYLRHRPVTSITSIVRTGPWVTAADQTLVEGTDYKLWDPNQGLVLLTYGWGPGYALKATYIHTENAPADIVELTTQVAAGMMRLVLNPDLAGVKKYTLWGGDLSVELAEDPGNPAGVVSNLWKQVVGSRRIPVIV